VKEILHESFELIIILFNYSSATDQEGTNCAQQTAENNISHSTRVERTAHLSRRTTTFGWWCGVF